MYIDLHNLQIPDIYACMYYYSQKKEREWLRNKLVVPQDVGSMQIQR